MIIHHAGKSGLTSTKKDISSAKRPLFTRGDWILICVLCAVLLSMLAILLVLVPRGTEALITVDGREVCRLPLDTDTTFSLHTEYGTHTVVVQDGKVSVTSAPCRDLICQHHAPVSKCGETIVCLPCRVIITVTDAEISAVFPSEGGKTDE